MHIDGSGVGINPGYGAQKGPRLFGQGIPESRERSAAQRRLGDRYRDIGPAGSHDIRRPSQ